jgi:hypothetical protein
MSHAENSDLEPGDDTSAANSWLTIENRNKHRGIHNNRMLVSNATQKQHADAEVMLESSMEDAAENSMRRHSGESLETQTANPLELLSSGLASQVPSEEDIECLARDIQRAEALSKVLGAIRMGELVTSRLGIDERKQGSPSTLRRLSDALARQGARIPASTLSRNVALYRLFREHVFVEELDQQLSVLYEMLPLEPVLRARIVEWTRNSPGVTVQHVRQYIAAQKEIVDTKRCVPSEVVRRAQRQKLSLPVIDREMAELTALASACPDCPEFIRERLAEVAKLIHQLVGRYNT